MRYAFLSFMIVVPILACENDPRLSNNTHPGGYAMGENVKLDFSLTRIADPPDSVEVWVVEKKTGYTYTLYAGLIGSDSLYRYSCIWDGRKANGRWPVGGRYLVYAMIESGPAVFSDTVEVGLTD